MRNGQKRMRGRSNNNNNNHRKSQNPLIRVYESNGPDVKIRGTASHIAEKYIQLARDSQSSGDPVAAENYYQHAEHYFRLIAVAQEQFRQQNPYYNNQQNPQGQQATPQGAADDNFDDDGDDGQPFSGQNEPSYTPQPPQAQPQPQPFIPRDAQPFPPRDQHQPRPQQQPQHQPQQQPQHQPYVQPSQTGNNAAPDVTGLPAFITGGGQPQPIADPNGNQTDGPNGHERGGGQDRFGHRRRRRHRPGGGFQRPDNFGNAAPQGAAPTGPSEGGDEPPRQPD
ncbi:MAG: DUF4167 domain-containing protein [Pseudolabrys sp.]|nr:DUF4167 domain-containing protein [Pseudolabrys sp.]